LAMTGHFKAALCRKRHKRSSRQRLIGHPFKPRSR
jgi:hypothetical protein